MSAEGEMALRLFFVVLLLTDTNYLAVAYFPQLFLFSCINFPFSRNQINFAHCRAHVKVHFSPSLNFIHSKQVYNIKM